LLDPLEHAIYRIRISRERLYPFPHIWVEDVFPTDFYEHTLKHLSQATRFQEMLEYPGRQFSDDLPQEVKNLFFHPRWFFEVASCFGQGRSTTIRWTRDRTGYHLDPHTDHPDKVWTALFYMPQESDGYGTSLYLPKDRRLRSDGQQKHPRDQFDLIYTFPFQANCMLAMTRTDDSWHGVEPLVIDKPRDILFYTLNR
jgi:hypothetical protein